MTAWVEIRLATAVLFAATLVGAVVVLAPPVRAGPVDGSERVRVLVGLHSDPVTAAAARPGISGAIGGRLSRVQLRQLRAGNPAVVASLVRAKQRERALALGELQPAANRAARMQQPVVAAIEAAGGYVTERHLIGNAVVAVVPPSELERLRRRSDVAAVEREPEPRPLSLAVASGSVGASSFWAVGHEGGRGSGDTALADLAILQDKVQQDHPAFAGIDFVSAPGTPPAVATLYPECAGSPASTHCWHGTAVASIAAAGGAPGSPQEKGVAPGPGSVLDADGRDSQGCAIDNGAWAIGITLQQAGDCSSDPVAGVADPAEVFNLSRGSFNPDVDDSLDLRITDNRINVGGVVYSIAAGNEGPGQAVASPSIAYNTISVGAFDPQGDTSPANDAIADFSSRGPTPGGRKKPDMVAVGVPGTVANWRWGDPGQPLFAGNNAGTSFSAPQVAGAATLLSGSGITDPLAIKAILINSARQGRATTAQPMGTQTGWQPDWGWGALDLSTALDELTNFQTGEAAPGIPRFYRANVQAAGDRATLVWARRTLVGNCPGTQGIGPGCMPEGVTLTNLDLRQRDAVAGDIQTESESTVDNVEQVRSPATGDAIYEVEASSDVQGAPGEPFALASRRVLTALATPAPTVDAALSDTEVEPGETVEVTATIENPSADLEAEEARVAIELPAGVELVSGQAERELGTLAEAGESGDSQAIAWTVRGTTDGLKQIEIAARAETLGEVVYEAPTVLGLTVATPEQPGESDPPASTPTQPGVTAPVDVCRQFGWCPPPERPRKRKLKLTLSRASLGDGRLVVRGRIAPAIGGRLKLTYWTPTSRTTLTLRRTIRVERGRFRVAIRLPAAFAGAARGTLTLRHSGNGRYGAARVERRLKRV